jgi:hypothetical protein
MKKTKSKRAVAPKMPRTAYNLYLKERWKELPEGESTNEKVKKIAQEWKELKETEGQL